MELKVTYQEHHYECLLTKEQEIKVDNWLDYAYWARDLEESSGEVMYTITNVEVL